MFAVPVAVAAFLTLTDAFGLDMLPLGKRFLYWLVLLGIGQAGSLAVRASLDRLPLPRMQLVLAGLLRTVLLALPLTLLVWLATAFVLSPPLRVVRLPQLYLPVLVVVAAMVAINLLLQRRPHETHAEEASGTAKPAAILARFPPKLRGAALYAVEAEDHYIRLHTSAGSDLVLLRSPMRCRSCGNSKARRCTAPGGWRAMRSRPRVAKTASFCWCCVMGPKRPSVGRLRAR